ncbi:MAG: glycosyltransferase [Candidatus Endonucleobacter sp. (ex Gigantidas childressi)]|nr:glycosyltransferase [Candidatus Endonucleobacter sp. (ex Gigantidas childressi)]
MSSHKYKYASIEETIFSDTSDVTVVITCCGRIDLLKKTLNSFFEFNTYPIKKMIITEDSGNHDIYSIIPEEHKNNFLIIINSENVGQIRSIDKAYAKVDTYYIFHCEEDWIFYRKGFIENSKSILISNDKVYQVWLRSYYHDIHQDYPFHTLGEDISANGVTAYRLLSSKQKWQGFSFNPGLRRLSDYHSIPGGYRSFLTENNSSLSTESALSKHMRDNNMFAAVLENDAVAHIGYNDHIKDKNEIMKKRQKKITRLLLALLFFLLGWSVAFFTTPTGS